MWCMFFGGMGDIRWFYLAPWPFRVKTCVLNLTCNQSVLLLNRLKWCGDICFDYMLCLSEIFGTGLSLSLEVI